MKLLTLWIGGVVVAGLALGIGKSVQKGGERAKPRISIRVERGKYLVGAIGCGDCHTPKNMGPNGPAEDMRRLLSGHPEDPNLPAPPRMPAGPWMAVASWDLTA